MYQSAKIAKRMLSKVLTSHLQPSSLDSGLKMFVDSPIAGSSSGRLVTVSGWAFHPTFPIRSVQVFYNDKSIATLSHGIERRDVYETFSAPRSLLSGFQGTIALSATESGEHTIIVRVHASNNSVIETAVTISIFNLNTPYAEIDQLKWENHHLSLSGWALWPQYQTPNKVRFFIDDTYIGQTSIHLSRLDIRHSFPSQPDAVKCGFRFDTKLEPASSEENALPEFKELRAEFVNGNGHQIQRTVTIEHASTLASTVSDESSVDIVKLLNTVIPSIQIEATESLSLLNLNPNLALDRLFPALTVFSLPNSSSVKHLPYFDDSVHIVVYASDDPTIIAEAQRVAIVGSINLLAPSTNDPLSNPSLSHWHEKHSTGSAFPSVSIIIPVFNHIDLTQNCLQQLQATIPQQIPVEIIIVDDCSTDATASIIQHMEQTDSRIRYLRNSTNSGFVDSSNAGATAATGDILIFLNNDTLPEEGWLPPLLQIFRTHPDAGAVGGKLMYPNGTLQEAGGIIYSDASGCNYGRSDPEYNKPLYTHVRAVDYCSGALLATPRTLFELLGGFDLRYRPAYYEDVDYCFQVRAAGYTVYYQPASVIVHLEGMTSGTDITSGVKSYQVVNAQKFQQKWAATLPQQPTPPGIYDVETMQRLVVRGTPTVKKRVLVIAPKMPEFDREGGSRIIFHRIQLLCNAGWHVTFIAENATGGDRYRAILEQMGVITYSGNYTSLAGDEFLFDPSDVIRYGRFALALCCFWEIGHRYSPMIRSLSPQTKIVIETIDIHFLRNARQTFTSSITKDVVTTAHPSQLLSPPPTYSLQRLTGQFAMEMLGEVNTYAAADATFAVSQKETELVGDFINDRGRAFFVPVMEDNPISTIPLSQRKGMVFIGNFRHTPNISAIDYLCTQIIPLIDERILQEHPIYVIGNGVDAATTKLIKQTPYVHLVGWVPSVIPYLHQARLAVVPLLYGAGVKTKLIGSIMAGIPSVSTSVGTEGLDLVNAEHVLIADTAQAFAQSIEQLCHDDMLWRKLVARGYTHMASVHSAPQVMESFMGAIDAILPVSEQSHADTYTLPKVESDTVEIDYAIADNTVVDVNELQRLTA